MHSLPSLANERGAHQPEGGGQRRESLREGKRLKPREGGKGREPHTREECTPALAPARPRLKSFSMRTSVLQWSGDDRDLERLNPHSTCPAHGWPGPFQRTQSFSSKRDILLGRGKAFGLQELSSVLITQDGMHSLQEILSALWGAMKRRFTPVRETALNT